MTSPPLRRNLIFIAGLSHIRYQPPPVVSRTARSTVFSADRAEEVFQRLYENASPHPAGDNLAFRQKVIREFELLGYEVELHESQASPRNRRSSQELIPLTNLIIRLVGKADLPPVILAGHFDSVPGAPGAADDGAARAGRHGERAADADGHGSAASGPRGRREARTGRRRIRRRRPRGTSTS